MKNIVALSCLAFVFASVISANGDGVESRKQIANGLNYQRGEITVKNGLAKLAVPEKFRYLGPEDAWTVLTKIWGNPASGKKPLGMLLPADANPAEQGTWAAVIEYEENGYVKDNDAHNIDYADLLKGMQDATKNQNEARTKQGYPAIQLVGWAAPPRYDAAAKKLYWAKELSFAGEPENTLNYNIRMLGRRGVLVLNVVAGMSQLAEVEHAAPAILSMVEFQSGHRYADFNPSTDKVAAYGLAALVAGGLLAKGGFFKLLLVGLLAAKKFLIIGALALGSFVKKLFFSKKEPVV